MQVTANGRASLVTIQPGRANAPVVFAVPGAGSSVTSMFALTQRIGDEFTVYGLQPSGLDGLFPPHASVEEAAQEFLAAISNTRLTALCCIVGHSFGGWIAYELATRLAATGARIAPLALLDTSPPLIGQRLPQRYGRVDALMRLIAIQEKVAGKSLGLTRAQLDNLSVHDQLQALLTAMKSACLLPRTTSVLDLKNIVHVFEVSVNTIYRPTAKLDAAAILFVPELEEEADDEHINHAEVLSLWRRCSPKLCIRKAHGNHVTMLNAPHVESLGRSLRELWLDTYA